MWLRSTLGVQPGLKSAVAFPFHEVSLGLPDHGHCSVVSQASPSEAPSLTQPLIKFLAGPLLTPNFRLASSGWQSCGFSLFIFSGVYLASPPVPCLPLWLLPAGLHGQTHTWATPPVLQAELGWARGVSEVGVVVGSGDESDPGKKDSYFRSSYPKR